MDSVEAQVVGLVGSWVKNNLRFKAIPPSTTHKEFGEGGSPFSISLLEGLCYQKNKRYEVCMKMEKMKELIMEK